MRENFECRATSSTPHGGVGGTVASESALRSAGTLLSRVRAPPPAPWPDGGPEKPEITLLWTGYIQKPKPKPPHPTPHPISPHFTPLPTYTHTLSKPTPNYTAL
ncbi:hypothetical protein PoB_004146100 [Plakobranchus ocellatus]|uniref:Uncharacterized protein n=1 Tax=Plakobranchus ocellatus TaxID=259542 RepID=A0AAV4B810_9GAST|nr:hypothetical protein PoB_004146100 [Plakobranchus ocellatus]